MVTGGAGFIGSNLVEYLCSKNEEVVVVDNFSTGKRKRIEGLNVRIFEADISDLNSISPEIYKGAKAIFHLAANVDNRFSWADTDNAIRTNVYGSRTIAEAAKIYSINKIIYSSTTTVYDLGSPTPITEATSTNYQSTIYGATKLSGEKILTAYSSYYGFKLICLRFVGVLGTGCTHGHVYDFVRKLTENSNFLKVLGNGNAKKSYISIQDVLRILFFFLSESTHNTGRIEILNVGRNDWSTVRDSVSWICELMGVQPTIEYGQEYGGWAGDNPEMIISNKKLIELYPNLTPDISIEDSVKETTKWLLENNWVFAES